MIRSFALVLTGALVSSVSVFDRAEAQKLWYEAATGDSMMSLGMEPLAGPDGDTVLVDLYRSFAPIGDTIAPRRQALVAWAGVSAMVKTRGYTKAAIVYLWPKEPSDSLFTQGIAFRWVMLFAKDIDGCWHIVNDTTPISTCVVRDDPRGPGAETTQSR